MNHQPAEKPRYIDLYGRIERIVYKNSNVLAFIFADEDFGEIRCSAGPETILYYKTVIHRKYHLQVVLKGVPHENQRGDRYLNNKLFVKKVFPL